MQHVHAESIHRFRTAEAMHFSNIVAKVSNSAVYVARQCPAWPSAQIVLGRSQQMQGESVGPPDSARIPLPDTEEGGKACL